MAGLVSCRSLVWRNDCKEGKAVMIIRILRCRGRSLKYLYRNSSHNETPQLTLLHLSCLPFDRSHWHFCSTGELRLSRGSGCWTSRTQRSTPLGFGVNKTLTHDGDWIASLTAPANGTRGPPRPRLCLIWYNDQDLVVSSRSDGALKAVAIRRACNPLEPL